MKSEQGVAKRRVIERGQGRDKRRKVDVAEREVPAGRHVIELVAKVAVVSADGEVHEETDRRDRDDASGGSFTCRQLAAVAALDCAAQSRGEVLAFGLGQRTRNTVRALAAGNGIGVIVYSPMYSGLLTGAMTRARIASLAEDDWRRRDANADRL